MPPLVSGISYEAPQTWMSVSGTLAYIAEIVHDLDLKDAKFGRAEAAGVRMMLDGLMARTENDDERIERALVLFDDLHEALGNAKRTRK
jgi:hypothetical protein